MKYKDHIIAILMIAGCLVGIYLMFYAFEYAEWKIQDKHIEILENHGKIVDFDYYDGFWEDRCIAKLESDKKVFLNGRICNKMQTDTNLFYVEYTRNDNITYEKFVLGYLLYENPALLLEVKE